MIERIEDVPEGVLGLRSSGKLTRADYVEVLEPTLREAVESGGIRLLFVLDDFQGAEPGAWLEDMKTGFDAWFKHHSAWQRMALVTDVEWVAKATGMFAWLAPGEVQTFAPAELEEAKSWVAGL